MIFQIQIRPKKTRAYVNFASATNKLTYNQTLTHIYLLSVTQILNSNELKWISNNSYYF